MDNKRSTPYASFALLPAFTAGAYDGINPCGFASVLIFAVYLAYVGHTQKHIFWLGILFVISAILTHYTLAIGMFDAILLLPIALYAIRVIYWFLAASFLMFGVLNILDWWQYKKHFDVTCFRCTLPAYLNDSKSGQIAGIKKKIFTILLFILLAFFVAVTMTIAGSIYPQREYIFIVHSFLMAGGNSKFALLSFFQYSVASVLPLVLIWIVIFFVGCKARGKAKAISYYKGISSALFLSVGIGLGFFLLT